MAGENDRPDVLVYMSDQHGGPVNGFMGDPLVRTPNLDKIAKKAVVFTQAYTSCPLCVPARASMMTGRMPSAIDVFNNSDPFSSIHPTFAHSFGKSGYETILCGRMHFIGDDQRHGFEKRIAKDIVPCFWGTAIQQNPLYGDLCMTFGQNRCLEVIAMGKSPVLAYDDYVVDTALRYLESDHQKPQMMVVGTYAPHFPYVAPEELVSHYAGKTLKTLKTPEAGYPVTVAKVKMQYPKEKDLDFARAVYYAMTERLDEQVGTVYRAFKAYLERNRRKGVFVYISDHGDQIGEKHFFGKQTFFEYSSKIPWIITLEDGISRTGRRIDTPVSIMDLGNTICSLAGAEPPPLSAGRDQSGCLEGKPSAARPVLSEFFEVSGKGEVICGYMVRSGKYKFISYSGFEDEDLLFDMNEDPWETKNLCPELPEIVGEYQEIIAECRLEEANHRKQILEHLDNARYLSSWGKFFIEKNTEVWYPSPELSLVDDRFKHPEYRRNNYS
jgi:choline-sulfatase